MYILCTYFTISVAIATKIVDTRTNIHKTILSVWRSTYISSFFNLAYILIVDQKMCDRPIVSSRETGWRLMNSILSTFGYSDYIRIQKVVKIFLVCAFYSMCGNNGECCRTSLIK